MVWSSLGQFWKVFKIKQLKVLMPASLTPKSKEPLNFIESSHEHLVPTKFLFKEPLKSYGSLYFTAFSLKPVCHTFVSFGTTQTKLIESIFQSFFKDILLSKISLPTSWPFKNGELILNFHCTIFWTTSDTDSFFNPGCVKRRIRCEIFLSSHFMKY